ncbi:MAG TPA: ABC transporter permease [Acidimicrobiia bacterium]|jgi:NitT/TauT family transport system permease protein
MGALRRYVAPAVVFLGVLGLWQAWVRLAGIEGFLLPPPTEIIATLRAEWRVVWAAGLFTLREALGGLVAGTAAGILAAFATSRWLVIREGIFPFYIAMGAAPIVALAPITNQWFGITNPLSKMTVVAVMVFFPVMINTVRGLSEVDAGKVELMRSIAAKDSATLTKVRLPNALPYLFSALKVAVVLSLIGAIVAEYFGGSRAALGVYISQQAGLTRMAEAWSGIVVATLLGAILQFGLIGAERLLIPWHPSRRSRA